MTDETLPGMHTDPRPPTYREVGYLTHLAQLPYPDRATFWSLAEPPRRRKNHGNTMETTTEWVHLHHPGKGITTALIDTRNGTILEEL